MERLRSDWISESRYFYRAQSLRPLSVHAQALWHYLIYRENEAFWQSPIYLHATEIAGALKISGTTFKKARRELVEGGYLIHEAASGNRAAGYVLLSNVCQGLPISKASRQDLTAEPRGQPSQEMKE